MVQISGSTIIYAGSLSSPTEILGGTEDDTMIVGALPGIVNLVPVRVNAIRDDLHFDGGDGNDSFRFDDRATLNPNNVGELSTQIRRGIRVGTVSGFGMTNTVTYGNVENMGVTLGSTINQLTISDTPTTVTRTILIDGGSKDDTFNINKTRSPVTIFGQGGVDVVNVGKRGNVRGQISTVRPIEGLLTLAGVSQVNVNSTSDSVGRTVLLYDYELYNVIRGLSPADIFIFTGWRNSTLQSVNINAGSGGNTVRIHDTPTSTVPGGVTTTFNTGVGSDSVLITGLNKPLTPDLFPTSSNLILDLQTGTNTATVGSSSPTTGLNSVSSPIVVRGSGISNTLNVVDGASTAPREYLVDRNLVQRLDRPRIEYQNVSTLNLGTGAAGDRVQVLDTIPTVGISGSTNISTGGGNDRVNVLKTTGYLFVNAANSSIVEVGSAVNSLDNIQGGVIVLPSGGGNNVTLRVNDQAATTPQQLDVVAAQLGTAYRRSGSAEIDALLAPLANFEYLGGSDRDTVNVNVSPAKSATFLLGDGNDSFSVGTTLASPTSLDGYASTVKPATAVVVLPASTTPPWARQAGRTPGMATPWDGATPLWMSPIWVSCK